MCVIRPGKETNWHNIYIYLCIIVLSFWGVSKIDSEKDPYIPDLGNTSEGKEENEGNPGKTGFSFCM